MRMSRCAEEIAEVIGREAALLLIGQAPRWPRKDRHGRRVPGEWVALYVPASLPPDHFLVRTLGWKAARALADAFGGEILQPGCCRGIYYKFRNASIVRLHTEQEIPVRVLAEWFEVSERHVRNLLRDAETPRVANDNSPGNPAR